MPDASSQAPSLQRHVILISGVVNSAGIMSPTPIEALTSDDFRRPWGVNVSSVAWAAKHALPHLRTAPRDPARAEVIGLTQVQAPDGGLIRPRSKMAGRGMLAGAGGAG